MLLEALFEKRVDRSIEGVIKADDDVALYLELDEYVITKEVAKRLELFLDAYLNYQGANGVWVSGFFGSGKSHLLKMLALLLENAAIDNVTPLEVFLEKAPLSEGGIFTNDLKRAVNIPSESILFNIDQKADVISKTELDALIAVFVKVFDEHCGYYGKQAYIAQFERDLESDGQLADFRGVFETISGMPWDKGRARAKRMSSSVDKAYSEITGQPVTDILDKYRLDYRLSIEDFADQVKAYIDSKENDFRLNFFVDEVGQYIADNVKLMTNLQTVAESLATKCQGRAWIIVTAQEDMSSVVGETSKQQSNDFTKIQARFKNRMKLTSQDVAEVIQLRLLEKKEEYVGQLNELYQAQVNNFPTLFDFADGSSTYKNFKDSDHFVQCYPFTPYQFSLFQSAIQNLSTHSAFEGKHSSVGERSMLGVFQQVAIAIKGHELGDLATFDLMFEGIRTALKTAIQQSILRAEQNLDNTFAVRLLKALFLVKYVKDFKPTVRNLCVLMHDSFERDIPSLKLEVEDALNLLEKETYIQRNGELFEYLTDEEQDIEQEIKNTEIDTSAISSELEKLVFDGVIKNRKIRWDQNNQDYPYTKRLDDNLSGREYELGINVITPFHEYNNEFEKHKSDTAFNHELRIVMPDNDRLLRDLMLYKQTEKYVAYETRSTKQDSIKRILTDKGIQNGDRLNQLKLLTAKLLSEARYFVSGQELELTGEDAQLKVIKGFGELIKHTYPHLKMLRGIQYSESDIPKILTQGSQGLFGDETQLPEPQQEMMSFIQANVRAGIRTTAKTLLSKFESKPYGWSFAAVLCTLAHLCARSKVEVRSSTNLLDDAELAKALSNTASHANLILDPQVQFTQSQIRNAKEFYAEYFEKVTHSSEAKALAGDMKEAFDAQRQTLEGYLSQSERYPFIRALTPVIESLNEIKGHPYTWFVTELVAQEEQWFDHKEGTIDPIHRFMTGPNKSSFDSASELLKSQGPNLSYLDDDSIQRIRDALVSNTIYQGNAIQSLKADASALQKKLDDVLAQERVQATEKIDALKTKLLGFEQCQKLSDEQRAILEKGFDSAYKDVETGGLIASIRDTATRCEDQTYSRLVAQLMQWSQPKEPPVAPPINEGKAPDYTPDATPSPGNAGDEPKPAAPVTVTLKEIKVDYSKPWLDNAGDVDGYLSELKSALLQAINDGKKVQL